MKAEIVDINEIKSEVVLIGKQVKQARHFSGEICRIVMLSVNCVATV